MLKASSSKYQKSMNHAENEWTRKHQDRIRREMQYICLEKQHIWSLELD